MLYRPACSKARSRRPIAQGFRLHKRYQGRRRENCGRKDCLGNTAVNRARIVRTAPHTSLPRLPPALCLPARSRPAPCRPTRRRISSVPAAALRIGPIPWPVHRICWSYFPFAFGCLFLFHGAGYGKCILKQMPPRQESGEQHWEELLQALPNGRHGGLCLASALFASPKQASAIPARPTPNRFKACRRVTDWANPLANSSNLLFITFLSFLFVSLNHRFRGW